MGFSSLVSSIWNSPVSKNIMVLVYFKADFGEG